ncbi:MAG: hypothetical protein IPK55_11600 [Streptococcus sp.]|nr:hypothetical protein [Streptococcus sp.]
MANNNISRDSIKEFIVTCMWGIVMEKTQKHKVWVDNYTLHFQIGSLRHKNFSRNFNQSNGESY